MEQDELDNLNVLLDRDIETREKMKDAVLESEKRTRSIVGLLSKIHGTSSDAIPALLDRLKPMFKECTESIVFIADLIPENEYWRWSNMWTNTLRTAVFSAVLVEYLDNGSLLSHAGVASAFGVRDDSSANFKMMIQAEDYLHALITVVNELSRWAVNSVTLGDFERPIRISIFVKDLFAGFSMLNLKNDSLRRRFDSLKYDIKKIEEGE